MTLPKSKQLKEHTCGPAVLSTALKLVLDIDVHEDLLSAWSHCNEDFGAYPEDLLKAGKRFQPNIRLLTSSVEAEKLMATHCLLLLISTSPNYGHWVLSLPNGGGDGRLIDDPWDAHYWTMSKEQLDDCWFWKFNENRDIDFNVAIDVGEVSQDIIEQCKQLKTRPWDLPKLSEFPEDFVWSEESVNQIKLRF